MITIIIPNQAVILEPPIKTKKMPISTLIILSGYTMAKLSYPYSLIVIHRQLNMRLTNWALRMLTLSQINLVGVSNLSPKIDLVKSIVQSKDGMNNFKPHPNLGGSQPVRCDWVSLLRSINQFDLDPIIINYILSMLWQRKHTSSCFRVLESASLAPHVPWLKEADLRPSVALIAWSRHSE